MADQGVQLDQDQFCCCVCRDLLKEPATIGCGHSFCSSCINACWDNAQRGVYSCPLCRQIFNPRPVVRRNPLLAKVVEKLNDTSLKDASSPGPGDVMCDLCTVKKQKACSSCVVCLASYCESHLQPHYDSAPLRKHKLVRAWRPLQEKLCPHHDELMTMFCCTDQQCICYLCFVGEHKGHKVVSAAAERKVKQRNMAVSRQEIRRSLQERETEVQRLQQNVGLLYRSAQTARDNTEEVFTELICCLGRRFSEVKTLISDQQRSVLSQVKGLVVQLEEKRSDLRRRDEELEQLQHTEEDIHFLQSSASLSHPTEPPDVPEIKVKPLDVSEVVSVLSEELENLLNREWANITATGSCHITVDINTTHRSLRNHKVILTPKPALITRRDSP